MRMRMRDVCIASFTGAICLLLFVFVVHRVVALFFHRLACISLTHIPLTSLMKL